MLYEVTTSCIISNNAPNSSARGWVSLSKRAFPLPLAGRRVDGLERADALLIRLVVFVPAGPESSDLAAFSAIWIRSVAITLLYASATSNVAWRNEVSFLKEGVCFT